VDVVENPAWRARTDASGNYSFDLVPGSYTIRASRDNYFSQNKEDRYVDTANSPLDTDFILTEKDSGTVVGTVWKRDHLVISRVVGSSTTGGFDQEYVEIFNPTTWTWRVAGEVGLRYQRDIPSDPLPLDVAIIWSSTWIASGGFYLFANTGTVTLNGTPVGADAVWEMNPAGPNVAAFGPRFLPPGDPDVIERHDGGAKGMGSLELRDLVNLSALDVVGWEGGGNKVPGMYEEDPMDQTNGIEIDEQYMRRSSTMGWNGVVGPAYDSDDNDTDWIITTAIWVPRNSSSPVQSIISGTPAEGAYIFADDGLSSSAQASLTGDPPYAEFTLSAIATGTWTISASSETLYVEISTTLTAGSVKAAILLLSSTIDSGYISGNVKDGGGANLTGVTVNPGGAITDGNGNYRLVASPGLVNVVANPGSILSAYVEKSSGVTVVLGQLESGVNFTLTGGGIMRGFITSDGTNPLPDIPVSIVNDATSLEVANELSDITGYFEASVPAADYVVTPIPSFGEVVAPASVGPLTVNGGDTIFSSTFTMGPALGAITGSVTYGGDAIETGVLIVATTGTISGGPPDIDTALRYGFVVYYMASSDGGGNYQANVHEGTYNIYAWYTTFVGGVAINTQDTITGVVVTAGDTTPGQDLAW